MKRFVAVALFSTMAVASSASGQIRFCGSKAPAPDDQYFAPGLVAGGPPYYPGYAEARLYLSPDGVYDKPVVIPTPFDAAEQTKDHATPDSLYEAFSPFIDRIRPLGYDVWIVYTKTGQNIHEQAAEFAQVVQHAASRSPSGKVIIAAYSLGGVTARLATARWEADPNWRNLLGLSPELPVSLIIFGDAPLRGAQVNEELQFWIWKFGPFVNKAGDFNLNSCGAQQLLRQSYSGLQDRPTIDDVTRNWRAFYEEGRRIFFAPNGVADLQGTTPDGKRASICESGPPVFFVNGDGWPHNPCTRIVGLSDAMPGPMMCYGDFRDLTRDNQSVCPHFPGIPPPRAPRIFDTMYVVNTVLGGPTPIVATSEDLEGGSRLGTVLNKPGPTVGVSQNFAGTFIPVSSSIPAGNPFAAVHYNTFMGVHGRGCGDGYEQNVQFAIEQMELVTNNPPCGGPPPPPPPLPPPGPACRKAAPTTPPLAAGPTGCFSSTRPVFSWSAVGGADDYKIAVFEATPDGSDPLLFFQAVPGTSIVLPFDLSQEKRYRWKVKARNCAGDGPYSEIKYFTISTNCTPPSTSPVLSGPQGCVDAVRPTFSWSAVPRSTAYRIVVSPADHDNFFIDQFVSATSIASPVALNPRTEYRFKVRAVNDSGAGPWSSSMYFTPFCGGVASMITSPLGCTSTSRPVFSWLPVRAAVQYWLLVANSPDFSARTTTWFVNVHLRGTSYAPGMAFAPGKTYYAKVKSILDPTSTTAAAWSPTVSFTTGCVSSSPP